MRVLLERTILTEVIVMFLAFACAWMITRIRYWRSQANGAFKRLAKLTARQSNTSIDLDLATTEQIIEELGVRPNSRFMLLVPHEDGPHLHVEIHAANLPIEMALAILKNTYEGVMESFEGEEDDDDDDFSNY